jgi:DNA-binding CsgD family transcriptional regulator
MSDGDPADRVARRTMTPAHYLGAMPTALIGRAPDLARLASVLDAPDAALVTVTGPAGVGKTRLVMEFFSRRRPAPGRPVGVCDFGRSPDASACERILRRLTQHRVVLLDHFEDVADELVPLLAEFRRCCPQVQIVCIGTTALGLYGERVVRLRPLPTASPPATGLAAIARIPAVQLFIEYARSVQPEFALTTENTRPVLALCELLGGLPFAIELSAAQVRLASPEAILEGLEHGRHDLRRPSQHQHPYSRYAGIADMVAWTFAQLSAEERTLLTRLAVFQGPFTMRAAAEVLGEGIDRSVERLIDKSVLIPEQRPDGEPVLSVPALIRSAAADPSDHRALRRSHAAYFRTIADDASPDTRADLLAAFHYWHQHGDAQAMAAIVHGLRGLCTGAEQTRQCLRLAREVLRMGTGDPQSRARTLETAGELSLRLGAEATGHLTEARDAYRAAHDGAGDIRCLRLLADAAYACGDLDVARRRYEEGLATLTASDPDRDRVRRRFIWGLTVTLRESGALSRAAELARTALATELSCEDIDGAVHARYLLATIRWLEQDSAESRALFADAAAQLDGRPERPECLELMLIALDRWSLITDRCQAAAVLALAARLRRHLGSDRPAPLARLITPILATAGELLPTEEYAAAVGADLSWAAALRLVPHGEPIADREPEADAPLAVVDILTKRELEVALLVAEGLTNRAIAHKLGIAEWTVVNHLRKVMRKLGCQSRVHVALRLDPR